MRVALVHSITRPGGASVRLRWWEEVLRQIGCEVQVTSLFSDDFCLLPHLGHLPSVARHHAVPETLAWSGRRLYRELHSQRPDLAIFLTLRAFDPNYIPTGTRILVDYIDQLSASYRQRSSISTGMKRQLWRRLASFMAEVESRMKETKYFGAMLTSAAGRHDSLKLGAQWLPNTRPLDAIGTGPKWNAQSHKEWDLIFTGTLDYPPNVAAIRELKDKCWPALQQSRPGISICIAGRRPTKEVKQIAKSLKATLIESFSNIEMLFANAQLAIAPLSNTTGIQNKVLDAAAYGIAQIVTPEVAAGFDADFPLIIEKTGPAFADKIARLLEAPKILEDSSLAAWQHMKANYSTEKWAPIVETFINIYRK